MTTSIERVVRDLFSDSKFIGDVIRYSALLEFELDCLLAQYFIRKDHVEEGISFVVENLNFNDKIEILAKLPVRQLKSFKEALSGLRRFRRIRNMADGMAVNRTAVRSANSSRVCQHMVATLRWAL